MLARDLAVRLPLTLIALLAAVSPARAQQAPWANKFFTAQNPPPPYIVHDFGTAPAGSLLSHRFTITNIYKVPMQIMEIRKSCGCVEATASTQTLQPREAGTIDVTMDLKKFTGSRTVTIQVAVGPKFLSTALLQVKAYSRADVMLNPGAVNFGVVAQGQPATQTVDVQFTGQGAFAITGVASNKGPFVLNIQPNLRAANGAVVHRVSVALAPNAPPGPIADEIVLSTNDPNTSQLPIQITGMIQAPLAVTPAVVKFDPIKVGNVLTQRVIVRGSGKAFRILSVRGDGDGVSVELPPAAQPVQIVTVKVQPEKAGSLNRQLTFQTDLDGGATASVSVEAAGVP